MDFKENKQEKFVIHILGKKNFLPLCGVCFSVLSVNCLYVWIERKNSKHMFWNIKSSCLWCGFGWFLHFFPSSAFLLHGLLLLKHKYYLSSKIKRQLFSFRKIVKTLWEWCKSENKDQWTRIRNSERLHL